MLAAFNTNTAACTGVLGWVLVDYIKHRGKFSVVGACEGAIAGLDHASCRICVCVACCPHRVSHEYRLRPPPRHQ